MTPRSVDGPAVDLSRPAPSPAWYREALARLGRICRSSPSAPRRWCSSSSSAYRHLLNYPRFPVTEMPLTELDHLIGFWPPALILYVSLWVYVTVPSALLPSLRELVFTPGRSVWCASWAWVASSLAHRGVTARRQSGALSWLQRLDGTRCGGERLPVASRGHRGVRGDLARCPAARDAGGPGGASRELGVVPRDRVLGDGDQATRGDRCLHRGRPGRGRGGARRATVGAHGGADGASAAPARRRSMTPGCSARESALPV